MLVLALAAAGIANPISVSRGGDDGLTNRFADAYERAIQTLPSSKRLDVTVEQVVPVTASRSRVILKFRRGDIAPATFACDFLDDRFNTCVRKAVKRTHKLVR